MPFLQQRYLIEVFKQLDLVQHHALVSLKILDLDQHLHSLFVFFLRCVRIFKVFMAFTLSGTVFIDELDGTSLV